MIFLAALFAISLAQADEGAIRAQIQEVLVQRHPSESEDWWRGLGSETPGLIIGMYQSSNNTLHQIHLLQGLSAFHDDSRAAEFLRGETKSGTSVIRGAALGALGASQGEKALDTLALGLKNPDVQTRFAAAKAIHRLGGRAAKETLENYLKSERVDWISSRVLADERPVGLKPVDRASPEPLKEPSPEDFAGSWKGYWIVPELGQKPEIVSAAATATIRVVGKEREIEGELTTGGRHYSLGRAKLQAGRWQGQVEQTSPVRSRLAPVPGEMQVAPFQKRFTLVLRVPSTGVTAVLLKDQRSGIAR
jgi:hypothetical protein